MCAVGTADVQVPWWLSVVNCSSFNVPALCALLTGGVIVPWGKPGTCVCQTAVQVAGCKCAAVTGQLL